MPLTGSNRIAVRPRGGVVRVGLASASDLVGAPDPASGFSEYVFREDRAHYQQTLTGDEFRPLTRHTLTIELPATAANRAAAEGIRTSAGVVARIELASGEVVLAGWSERFEASYPLLVTALETTSGSVPEDYPTVKLTLECFS